MEYTEVEKLEDERDMVRLISGFDEVDREDFLIEDKNCVNTSVMAPDTI